MAILAFLIFYTSVSAVLFMAYRSYYYRRLRIPPGSFGLPLVGETLQLISAYKSENPEPFIDERVKRFGPVFTTHVLGEPTVMSADPETNRFILQNEGKLFESDYPSSISNLLGKHSLLVMKGSLHKRMHSLTMSFANHSIIKDHLLVHMDRLIRLNLDSWSDRVFLLDEAKKITFDLTMKQLMSVDPGEWTESLRKEYLLLIDGFFTVPFISTTYRRAIKARTKVAEALRLVIRERRKEGGEGKRKKDMLAALLVVDEGFSDEQIEDFFVALLVAGYETTSTIMTLAVKFLTETPLALAQVQEEHEQIRAKMRYSEAIEWNEYKSMHFTQCVVNETLRIANIIGGIFRRAMTDVHFQDYTIPKGWKVFASFRAIHLNNDHFNDARTFNPWRWHVNPGTLGYVYKLYPFSMTIRNNKACNCLHVSVHTTKQNNSEPIRPGNVFTPFGGGPRLCPGYELARVELSVFLHYIVTRISWAPAEKDKLIFFPTTRTQKRYPIIVHRRNFVGQLMH